MFRTNIVEKKEAQFSGSVLTCLLFARMSYFFQVGWSKMNGCAKIIYYTVHTFYCCLITVRAVNGHDISYRCRGWLYRHWIVIDSQNFFSLRHGILALFVVQVSVEFHTNENASYAKFMSIYNIFLQYCMHYRYDLKSPIQRRTWFNKSTFETLQGRSSFRKSLWINLINEITV